MAKASAYLVGPREDGHESAQHGGADAGDVDEWPLAETDRYRGVTLPAQTETTRSENRGLKVGRAVSQLIHH